ncbi:hypothetical protein BaRGS_00030120 [Batillaria attramentaria]|uniref:G-protein coupled receptors family 1 profile domain-containing protein n=1 Tax=Batillaria attramentaria TaxID=370345 RepID=A0ABD0JUD4_9CAEN
MTFGPVCEDINMTNLTDAEFQDLKQSATDMTSHHNVYIVFALSVVGFAGIPGNTIVLVAWLKSPALKCSVRYYVMAIAAYNLLACLVGIPADIAELYLLVRIIDPIILCK